MAELINIFGGKGFIGSNYAKLYPDCVVLDRDEYQPKPMADVLYTISTIDNYNIFTNPHLDIDTNLSTLITTLENWKNNYPLGTFVFLSSWFVYGNTDLPAKEDSYCNPLGFYSITKRTAEQLLISYCTTFNLKYRILRLSNVLGVDDSKVSKKKNALQYLIGEMKQGNPIELYDAGFFYRDYMDVEDCCRAINTVITKGAINEIYNISNGNGKEVLFKDLINYADSKIQSKSVITSIPQKEFHKKIQVHSMYMDGSKLAALGYTPKYTIWQTLDKIIDK